MVEGIQKFYNNKTIFITGASGFMGKVLLEKLLYSCSDMKEVFILMRPKRGKSGTDRVEEMTKLPVKIMIMFLCTMLYNTFYYLLILVISTS